MGMNYILDEEGKPQLCKNIIEWAEWFEGKIDTWQRTSSASRVCWMAMW